MEATGFAQIMAGKKRKKQDWGGQVTLPYNHMFQTGGIKPGHAIFAPSPVIKASWKLNHRLMEAAPCLPLSLLPLHNEARAAVLSFAARPARYMPVFVGGKKKWKKSTDPL